jgi:succinate dehydrogenase / fumarate reductase membrane anchor subunit
MDDDPGGLRTPLRQVHFLGSARLGTAEAWLVHLTSVALVPLGLGFVWLVLDLLHKDYDGVRATIGRPVPAILLLAFILTGVAHMELGMRSVILDYVVGPLRAWALAANACFCALIGLACVYATLRVGFT